MMRNSFHRREAVEHLPPKVLLAKLAKLEEEIQERMKALEGMLK